MPPVQTGPTHGLPVKADPNDWRVQILNMIKAPVNQTNLTALQAWALSESGYNSTYGTNMAGPGYFNPLAITDGYGVPSVRSINSDGVLAFPNTQAGVTATVRFWQHGYTDIIQALRSSDPVALYSAVNQSGWCAGCEGGHYPVGLYGWLQGGNVQGSGQKFKGGGPGTAGLGASGNAGGGGGGGGGGSDSGGLFGTCNITTSGGLGPIPGIPTGGFGCYIEKSFIFAGLAVGGSLLMAIGLGLTIIPGVARRAGPLGDVAAFGAGLASSGKLGKVLGKGSSPPSAMPAVKTVPSLAEQREKRQQERHWANLSFAEQREERQQERHRANLRRDRARAREAEARAREAELRAPTSRQRVKAAGEGRTKAAGPVGSGPARLAYETPGV